MNHLSGKLGGMEKTSHRHSQPHGLAATRSGVGPRAEDCSSLASPGPHTAPRRELQQAYACDTFLMSGLWWGWAGCNMAGMGGHSPCLWLCLETAEPSSLVSLCLSHFCNLIRINYSLLTRR